MGYVEIGEGALGAGMIQIGDAVVDGPGEEGEVPGALGEVGVFGRGDFAQGELAGRQFAVEIDSEGFLVSAAGEVTSPSVTDWRRFNQGLAEVERGRSGARRRLRAILKPRTLGLAAKYFVQLGLKVLATGGWGFSIAQ